jgi:uncharacterized protein (TIGR02145 family)
MKTKKNTWLCPLIVTGLILILMNSCKKDGDNNNPSGSIKDVDGNFYTAVTINAQTWMIENLKTTKYNDNTSIPNITDDAVWGNLTTSGYCWYNNDASTYKSPYGALYNWYAVNTGKLCPTGWHVPSDAEWTTLITAVGGETYSGSDLKEAGTVHWMTPNTGATNLSSFTALPGGYRYSDGSHRIGLSGFWWSSTEFNDNSAWYRNIDYDSESTNRYSGSKRNGASVRCVKD